MQDHDHPKIAIFLIVYQYQCNRVFENLQGALTLSCGTPEDDDGGFGFRPRRHSDADGRTPGHVETYS